MTTNQPSTDASATPTESRLHSPQHKQRLAWVALIGVLLLGGYFRTLGLFSWDDPSYRLHPDERFMTDVAALGRVPTSLDQYLDSSRNPLNPRNNGKDFYVYGLLPQTLTRLAAVMLTPDSKLPTIVPEDHSANAAQIPNPELRVPKLLPLQALLNPSGLNLTEYGEIHKVGRAWSALFDIGSLLLVFLIGRRLYGRRVGLLAALLLAGSVLPIQLAHFFTVDAITACVTLLTVYWAVRLAQGGGPANYLPLGLSIGTATACRVTMATLALLAVLVTAQRIWYCIRGRSNVPTPPNEDTRPAPSALLPALVAQFTWLALAGVLAFLAFRMLQPDAFLGTSAATLQFADHPPTSLDRLLQGRGFFDIRPDPRFVANYRSISEQFSGEADWPPSQQWAGRPRFLFALQNMVIWGMGVPLGLMAWAGWALAGWRIFRRRALAHLIPWAWITFYFAWQGGQAFMTMRYYSMLYGLLIIFAAWGLIRICDLRFTILDLLERLPIVNRQSSIVNCIAWVPLVVVVLGTFCWAYAFTRIYTQPHSRIAASRWIYTNIPAGAAITSESWDDGLPLDLDGYSHDRYIGIQTYPYAEDDESKYIGSIDKDGKRVPGLFDQLDQADYVILTSNRVYGSATRLPMRYPALTRYYHYLFNGELGFAQVADITSYPTLFGMAIPDQSSEEAFTVYDHPRVLIFKKNAAYSRANTERLIAGDVAWDEVYKLPTMRASKVPTALRLTETQWPGYRAAGTWATLFDPASLSNQVPALIWLLVLELIGLAAFPLLFSMLPGLPDRGFALAKTLALLLVAYAAWLLGSFHLLSFTPSSVWLCAGLLIVAGSVVGWRSRAELLAFARRRRTALLAAEGLFLLAFLGFVLIRALNPDLWHPARGGEKPMDLAFLTAVLKSDAFPAYDPWFAGGYINYYYFGFVFVGALIHLTGIVPTTAYNLAVPTLFALTALGAWGVVYNLVAPSIDKVTRRQADKANYLDEEVTLSPPHPVTLSARWIVRERQAIGTGIVAAAFVVLLGPLTQALWYLPGSAMPAIEGQPPGCQASYAVQQQPQCSGRAEWAFWDATRLIGMDLKDSTITEFPFFTFLFADLHAHMISLPLMLAALGLMVALIRQSAVRSRQFAVGRLSAWLPTAYCLLPLALVIGALRATNTWDYPTYLGLSLLTLMLIGWQRVRRGESQPRALLFWAVSSLVLVLGSSLLFLPFTRSFATDYAGFQLWTGSRTSAVDFLKINGLWLFLLGSAALLIYRRAHRTSRLILALIGGGALALALAAVLSNALALVLLVPLAGAALGMLVDLLFGNREAQPADERQSAVHDEGQDKALATAALIEDSRPPVSLTTQLPALWALAALMIALITEVLVAKGDIGRMNTVFKFGMQSWVLFGLTSALAFSALWSAIGVRRLAAAGGRENLGGRAGRAYAGVAAYAWRVVAVVLIGAALVYPLTATPARVADRIDTGIGPTLDGIAFMRSDKGSWGENNQSFTFVQDAAALAWMRTNVSGTPIVLEAHTEAYRWGGRVSIYTGLPTLLGWPWHETQQRSVATVGPVLASRQSLIQDLYSSTDQSAALRKLRLYGVEYIYLGQLERALYDPAGLAKFDALMRSGQIQQVYAAGDTRIYQIPRETGAPTPALLTTSLAVRAPTLPAEKGLLDTPIYLLPALNDYAWNRLADSQPVAVLLWLLACYALLALGLPPALLVFGRAADGGYAWARLIGLLLLGYAVWMPVSMRLWSYTRASVLVGALLVLALDVVIVAWLGRRAEDERRKTKDERRETDAGQEPGARSRELGARREIDDAAEGDETSSIVHRRSSVPGRPTTDDVTDGDQASSLVLGPWSIVLGLRFLVANLRSKRRAVLTVEVLFLGAFAFMTVLRALNPDLWQPAWGGEKPFEFGFFNAILRSPVMPPYDPFFSDGVINYYYYGLFLVSVPVKAIGIAPAVAFNLIVPTLFAFTLIGAFALVWRLTGRAWAGLAGGAFVALLGNLAAAFPVGLSQGLAPVRLALSGGLAGFGARLGDWFWGPSRVVYTDTLITINEFPYWSYLFADLHPHLIAMPITILVAAVAFELFDQRRTTNDERRTTNERVGKLASRREMVTWSPHHSVTPSPVVVGRWLLAALALGALAITNAWDFPTYVLLLGGALLGRAWRDNSAGSPARTRRAQVLALGRALLAAGGVVLAALLLYLPFFQNFQRPTGVSGLGLVKDGTPLGGYLLIYGLFLALLGLWVFGVLARLARGTSRPSRTALLVAEEEQEVGGAAVLGFVARRSSFAVSWRMLRLALASVLALLLIIVASQPKLAQGLWASPLLLKAGLLVLVVAGARVLLWRRLPAAAWFAAWLALLAWAVSFGIELFYLRDHLDGGAAYRMNTVFKFGLQAWILMALAAAAVLPGLARGLRRAGILAQGLVWSVVAALVALALIFPLVGTPSRLSTRFPASPGPTLDGLAFMDLATYDWQGHTISLAADADAIRWLNVHISGTPIVLQSSLEFYRAYGVRIAANTGLPTIVSPLHASEQHDPDRVADRDRDVQMIYSTLDPSQALQLLSKYHVGYVYVGPIERAAYGEPGATKFDQMDGSYLTLLYKNEAVKIYQVNQNVYSFAPETIIATQPTEPPLAAPTPTPAPNLDEPTIEALERQAAADPTASGPAFALAQRYRDTGQLDKAATAIEQAARAHSNDVALNQLWGDILRDAGRADQAEAAYRAAIAASPTAGNYNKLGVELIRWGKLDQAAEVFNQAIAADANVADPYYHLGEIYEQQSQPDQAAAQYRAYLNIAGAGAQFSAQANAALERLK
jgi:YYY domain-containing protein